MCSPRKNRAKPPAISWRSACHSVRRTPRRYPTRSEFAWLTKPPTARESGRTERLALFVADPDQGVQNRRRKTCQQRQDDENPVPLSLLPNICEDPGGQQNIADQPH